MYASESTNRHLDSFFSTHPQDRKVWFDTKDPGVLPELYDILVSDERFGVSDLVQLPEPHKTWCSWHLCGNSQKMLPPSGRTFMVRINDEMDWPTVQRVVDGKPVDEEVPRVIQLETGIKHNDRKYMELKAGRTYNLSAEHAVLAMDCYGPLAPHHNRNKLVEVRPWDDEPEVSEPSATNPPPDEKSASVDKSSGKRSSKPANK